MNIEMKRGVPLEFISIQLLVILWATKISGFVVPFDLRKNMYEYSTIHPLFDKIPRISNELIIESSYDFIIIGAGSGGSVVANRLSEIADWNILLLEVGGDENFLTDIPLLAPMMHRTAYNWGYKTQARPKNVDGSGGYCLSMIEGQCNWPRGKAVGGTSVINFMIYSRGSKNDFDRWAADGNPGWSYNDVLPYFMKLENGYFIGSNIGVNSTIYGRNGYLDITTIPWISKLQNIFLHAGKELGYNITDSNDESPIGFSPCKANLRNGRRVSAYKAFIKPIQRRKNFHLSKYSRVSRIIIDPKTKTAIGVEFMKNSRKYIVKAKKEVILSGGSLNSPQILMLSGIGPKEHLNNLRINVIEDLPVGYNLQDHVSMPALTFLVNDSVTIVEPRIASNYKNSFDYLIKGVGPFTVPAGAEALAFIDTKKKFQRIKREIKHSRIALSDEFSRHNPSKEEKKNKQSDGPDVELVFGIGSLAGDISGSFRSIFALSNDWYNRVFKQYEGQDAFSIVPVVLHPKSRGRVTLRSTNPFDWPIFEANYFENEEDLHTMVRGIKKAIKLVSTRPFQKYNATLLPVQFPGCLNLKFKADKYWECVSRQISTTLGHFIGTCKMGPRNSGGVVNERLKVHGIKQLRVVDASIMPLLISGHTNAPTYMIGEKQLGPVIYSVATADGRTWKRHVDQLNPRNLPDFAVPVEVTKDIANTPVVADTGSELSVSTSNQLLGHGSNFSSCAVESTETSAGTVGPTGSLKSSDSLMSDGISEPISLRRPSRIFKKREILDL